MENIRSINDQIKGIISKVAGYPTDELQDNVDFRNDLLIDSLKLMEILARVEIDFRISLDENELLNLDTLGDFYSYVARVVRAAS